MKKYFAFTLTGRAFLPIWLTFYILVIVPYFLISKSITQQSQSGQTDPTLALLILVIVLAAGVISFFIYRFMLISIKYGDAQVQFSGRFWTYAGKVILGFFLSLITLSIYMAWFIKDITKFFVNNSSLDSEPFRFRGKGWVLFLILLLTFFLPFILLTYFVFKNIPFDGRSLGYTLLSQAIVIVLMVPYMYMVYKWMVNISYKEYHLHWKTDFFASCIKILTEVLLSLITVGIYTPLAYLRLYQYFAERTYAEKEHTVLTLGYDLEPRADFLYLWGQGLLTIITLGLYYPWAIEKTGKRILSKTFSVKQEV